MKLQNITAKAILTTSALSIAILGSAAASAGENVAAQNIGAIYGVQSAALETVGGVSAQGLGVDVAQSKIDELRDPSSGATVAPIVEAERVVAIERMGDVAAENIRAIFSTSTAG